MSQTGCSRSTVTQCQPHKARRHPDYAISDQFPQAVVVVADHVKCKKTELRKIPMIGRIRIRISDD